MSNFTVSGEPGVLPVETLDDLTGVGTLEPKGVGCSLRVRTYNCSDDYFGDHRVLNGDSNSTSNVERTLLHCSSDPQQTHPSSQQSFWSKMQVLRSKVPQSLSKRWVRDSRESSLQDLEISERRHTAPAVSLSLPRRMDALQNVEDTYDDFGFPFVRPEIPLLRSKEYFDKETQTEGGTFADLLEKLSKLQAENAYLKGRLLSDVDRSRPCLKTSAQASSFFAAQASMSNKGLAILHSPSTSLSSTAANSISSSQPIPVTTGNEIKPVKLPITEPDQIQQPPSPVSSPSLSFSSSTDQYLHREFAAAKKAPPSTTPLPFRLPDSPNSIQQTASPEPLMKQQEPAV